LTITTGAETIDSVKAAASALRDKALESGLEAAAKEAGLGYAKTSVFVKGTPAPLPTYVQGANSFAFSAAERKAKISDVLENDNGVFVLERDASYEKGRDFARAREAVAKDLARVKSLEAAEAEAEKAHKEVVAASNAGAPLPPVVGKAVQETVAGLSAEAYSPGFGFGSPILFKAMRQKVGTWGPVLQTSEGAVFALVTASEPLPAAERSARIQAARRESDMFQTSNLYQSWAQDLTKMAKVQNRLDEVYRD
jgi:hypothetical protein